MIFRVIGLIFLGLIFLGCKLEPKTPSVNPTKFDQNIYSQQIKVDRDSVKNLTKNTKSSAEIIDSGKIIIKNQHPIKITTDTILVKIRNGTAKIDTVKTSGQRFVFVLNSDTANKLSLKITPKDSIANLRINQIIDAKNNVDGPFGRELEYLIKEKGIHQIIVSESQMAEQPWAGAFTFEAKLKW